MIVFKFGGQVKGESGKQPVLVHSGCYNKTIVDQVTYKPEKFVTVLEARSRTSRFCVWLEPNSWLTNSYLLIVFSHGRKNKGDLRDLFYKGTKAQSVKTLPAMWETWV